jgi:hypothetical protein
VIGITELFYRYSCRNSLDPDGLSMDFPKCLNFHITPIAL